MSIPSSGSSTWWSASTTSSRVGISREYRSDGGHERLGARQKEVEQRRGRVLDARALDHRDAMALGALDDAVLEQADLAHLVEVLVHRTETAGRRVPDHE